jgi:short-subunit dehydrogenase
MAIKAGQTALITGASSGIGAVFAQTLAGRGIHLILVARSEARLQEQAAELVERYGIRAEVIAADLSEEYAVRRLKQEIDKRQLSVDILINNAGFGLHGVFIEQDEERLHQQLLVNIAALTELAHAFLPAMVKQGEGSIINVASTAAFQPVPYLAVYAATKAYTLSFSQALYGEYRKKGVQVLALCPGATATSFFDVSGEGAAFGRKRTSTQVVTTALQALAKGKSVVIDGQANMLTAEMIRFLPRKLITQVSERTFRPQ